MKREILLLTLSCFFAASVFAQTDFLPGYVVKSSGDTIRGLIYMGSSKENSQKCIFKLNKKAKSTAYRPDDIQSYHYDNSLFYFSRPIKVEGEIKRVFLEWAVKGKLDLFLYVDPKKAMRYFVDKGDGGFVELVNTTRQVTDSAGGRFLRENKEYAATLAIMLQDCPTIIPEIYSSKFEAKDLIKVSADYHNKVCPDQQCTIFERPMSGKIVRIGPFIEYYSSTLKQPVFTTYSGVVQALSKIHYQTVNTFSAGAFFELSNFTFLSPRVVLRTELSYVQAKYGDAVYGTIYAVNRIRLAEMFKYSFTLGRFRPSLAVGPAFYIRTYGNTYNKSVTIVNAYNTEQTINIEFPTFKRGINVTLSGQLGFDYFVSDKVNIALIGGYEYLSQFVGYSDDKSYTKNITVQVGFGYRLK